MQVNTCKYCDSAKQNFEVMSNNIHIESNCSFRKENTNNINTQ
jgi:hypothetical protein